jgi:hypothetical protein
MAIFSTAQRGRGLLVEVIAPGDRHLIDGLVRLARIGRVPDAIEAQAAGG